MSVVDTEDEGGEANEKQNIKRALDEYWIHCAVIVSIRTCGGRLFVVQW
jgi:hypothetical protein